MKLLFFLTIYSFSVMAMKCQSPFIDYSPEELAYREMWDRIGHKLDSHDPENFIYLVTMIDIRHQKENYPIDSWAFKLLKNPALLSGNPMISASVISQDNLRTIFKTKIGLVLDVPCELLGPMSPWDMSSGLRGKKSIKEAYLSYDKRFERVYSPDEFLTHSTSSYLPFPTIGEKPIISDHYFRQMIDSKHNEVLILGKSGNHQVQVAGILINCDKDHKYLHSGTIKKYEAFNEYALSQCLVGYPAKDQVISHLKDLNGKYDFYLKSAL